MITVPAVLFWFSDGGQVVVNCMLVVLYCGVLYYPDCTVMSGAGFVFSFVSRRPRKKIDSL